MNSPKPTPNGSAFSFPGTTITVLVPKKITYQGNSFNNIARRINDLCIETQMQMDMDQKLGEEIKGLCNRIIDKINQISDDVHRMHKPDKSVKEDVVLDYTDVCQILHISVRHLRRLHNNKELVGFKNGRRRYYLSSEVQHYMQVLKDRENQ